MKWRALRTAAWLGWQIEANWTDPFLFAVYSILKPLAYAGILVVMFALATRNDFGSTTFAYIYLGNAFYMYVGAVMTGMCYAVVEDRERYRTMKFVYVAPIDFRWYLIGRGCARFVSGSVAVLITVLFGVMFLHVSVHLREVRWMLFLSTLAVGVVMLAMMGLTLASIVMTIIQQWWSGGEAVAGTLYLCSGAIFPLEVLPRWLRPVGFAMPVSYWLELLRRALVGHVAQEFPTLSSFSDLALFGILVVATIGFALLAIGGFSIAEHIARERGLMDRTTNY